MIYSVSLSNPPATAPRLGEGVGAALSAWPRVRSVRERDPSVAVAAGGRGGGQRRTRWSARGGRSICLHGRTARGRNAKLTFGQWGNKLRASGLWRSKVPRDFRHFGRGPPGRLRKFFRASGERKSRPEWRHGQGGGFSVFLDTPLEPCRHTTIYKKHIVFSYIIIVFTGCIFREAFSKLLVVPLFRDVRTQNTCCFDAVRKWPSVSIDFGQFRAIGRNVERKQKVSCILYRWELPNTGLKDLVYFLI